MKSMPRSPRYLHRCGVEQNLRRNCSISERNRRCDTFGHNERWNDNLDVGMSWRVWTSARALGNDGRASFTKSLQARRRASIDRNGVKSGSTSVSVDDRSTRGVRHWEAGMRRHGTESGGCGHRVAAAFCAVLGRSGLSRRRGGFAAR